MKEHDATETAYRNGYADGKPKWISVNDRLPEKDGWYLGITKNRNIYVLPFSADYKLFNTMSGSGTENAISVTHWMPLPSTEGLE